MQVEEGKNYLLYGFGDANFLPPGYQNGFVDNLRKQRLVKGTLHDCYQTLQLSSPALLSSKRDPCSLSTTRGSGTERRRGGGGEGDAQGSGAALSSACPSSPFIPGLAAAATNSSDVQRAARGIEGAEGPGACRSEETRTRCHLPRAPWGHSAAGSLAWAGEKGRSRGGTGDSSGGCWRRMLPIPC